MADLDLVRLELASVTDAEAIAQLSRREIEHGLSPAWVAARVLRRIRDRESIVLVARDPSPQPRQPSELLAFAIMRFGDDSAHLDLLAVERAWRRRGLGRRLMRWLEETARVAGTFELSLELRADNPEALAFYRALGFIEVARVPGYYEGRLDAVSMRRDLTQR